MAGPHLSNPINIIGGKMGKGQPIPPAWLLLLAKKYSSPTVKYGAFAGMMFIYFTDWKIFMDKVPFYRGKFNDPAMI